MKAPLVRTPGDVGSGHPEKFCNQVADSILDHTPGACPSGRGAVKENRTSTTDDLVGGATCS